MNKITLHSVLLLCVFVTGCSREYSWDPHRIDEGALQRPFESLVTGTKFRVLRDSGNRKPGPEEGYWVHYKGWVLDANDKPQIFDQSYSLGVASYFTAGGAISGFYDAMLNCPEGGMIEMEIPPEEGYGDTESELIPANSTLFFQVELVRIE
ncbi:MAG: FKBP-type peptidylprolyl isomerase [Planctomycetaceae bacterium]|nr:FKBP-type peptidylprolyl isomerase [Planctomycetaceae bacterium]|tara:strand:- start:264 stop:719 length:456 start_codon:yes stop_codon:yes gene_type:complete